MNATSKKKGGKGSSGDSNGESSDMAPRVRALNDGDGWTTTTTATGGVVAVEEKMVLGGVQKNLMATLKDVGPNKKVVTLNEFTFIAKTLRSSSPADLVPLEAARAASRDTKMILIGDLLREKTADDTVVSGSPTRYQMMIGHNADIQRNNLDTEPSWTKAACVVQQVAITPLHLLPVLPKTAKTPLVQVRSQEKISGTDRG